MERDYIRLDYWTSDRSLVVDFVFWDRGARGWRIYIISQIDYQGRNCSSHAAHQAIFEKFYISNDADMEFKVDAEFKPPFDQILEPVKDDIIRINRLAQDCSSKLSYYIDIAKDHIQKIFGCGLYTINNSTNMSTYSNGSNFFSHNSSSKVLLVELRGVEPLSKSRPPYERLQFSS